MNFMSENYFYIESTIPLEQSESLTKVCYENFKCNGVEEFSIEEAKVDEILGDRSYSGGDVPVSVIDEVVQTLENEGIKTKFYFETELDGKEFQFFLKKEHTITSVLKNAKIKDWNKQWRKAYVPIWISQQLEIVPEWERETYLSKAKYPLYIYPGMGFGTGSHETTFLCLKLFMQECQHENLKLSTCLDFGCGSGILGLAVNITNPQSQIDLYDISDEALTNSEQNIELNRLSKSKFNLVLPVDRNQIEKQYDVVFANILQNVLLLESTYLARCLNENGILILSGLLSGQEDEVVKAIQKVNPLLSHVEMVSKGDWVAVLMRKA